MENRKKVKRSSVKRSKVKRSKVKRSKVKRSKIKRSKVKRSKVKRSRKRKMKGGIDNTGDIFRYPCKLVVEKGAKSMSLRDYWKGDFLNLRIRFAYIPKTEKLCHVEWVNPKIHRFTGISPGDYLLNVVIEDKNGRMIHVEGLEDVTDVFTIEDIKRMIYKGLKEVDPWFREPSYDEFPTVKLVFGEHFLPGDDCTEKWKKRLAELESLKPFSVGKFVRLRDYRDTYVPLDTIGEIIEEMDPRRGNIRKVEFSKQRVILTRSIDQLIPVESESK